MYSLHLLLNRFLFKCSDTRLEFFSYLVTQEFSNFAFSISKLITKVKDECQLFFIKNTVSESHIHKVIQELTLQIWSHFKNVFYRIVESTNNIAFLHSL